MTYMASTWLFTAFNVTIVNAISLHVRIGLGYVLFLLSLLAVPLLDLLVHYCLLSIQISFYLTILSIAVVGIGSGGQFVCYLVMIMCLVCHSFSAAIQLLWSGRHAATAVPTGCHGRRECSCSGSVH